MVNTVGEFPRASNSNIFTKSQKEVQYRRREKKERRQRQKREGGKGREKKGGEKDKPQREFTRLS
jgi:hypothetical protein